MIIEVKNLHKAFGAHHVLRGVDLQVPEGQITVILGRSGQGKSVLLKHIIGLLQPDSGTIRVDGTEVTSADERDLDGVRRKCGLLFQDAALFDSMDVFDNVAFPLVEHTLMDESEIAARVERSLALVGLKGIEERWPDELSGGMRKRVGLARALVLEPKIILYDEPTTGLDPITSGQINRLIADTRERLGMTALVISHDLTSTREIADKVVMLNDGLIVEEGTAANFFKSRNPSVLQFLQGAPQGPMTSTERDYEA